MELVATKPIFAEPARMYSPAQMNHAVTKSSVPPLPPRLAMRRTCERCSSLWYLAPWKGGLPRT
jgi:hypothetical protein